MGAAGSFAEDLCVVTDSQDGDTSMMRRPELSLMLQTALLSASKNAFERLYPASTTKVMTAIIAPWKRESLRIR